MRRVRKSEIPCGESSFLTFKLMLHFSLPSQLVAAHSYLPASVARVCVISKMCFQPSRVDYNNTNTFDLHLTFKTSTCSALTLKRPPPNSSRPAKDQVTEGGGFPTTSQTKRQLFPSMQSFDLGRMMNLGA